MRDHPLARPTLWLTPHKVSIQFYMQNCDRKVLGQCWLESSEIKYYEELDNKYLIAILFGIWLQIFL